MIATGENAEAKDFWRTSLEANKSNSGTFAEETLLAGTLPGGTLTTGRHVRIKALFSDGFMSVSGNNDGCTIRLKLGSTTIATLNTPVNVFEGSWVLEGMLRFNGTNSQRAAITIHGQAGGGAVGRSFASGTGAEDLSSDLPISLTIQSNTISFGPKYACAWCSFELV